MNDSAGERVTAGIRECFRPPTWTSFSPCGSNIAGAVSAEVEMWRLGAHDFENLKGLACAGRELELPEALAFPFSFFLNDRDRDRYRPEMVIPNQANSYTILGGRNEMPSKGTLVKGLDPHLWKKLKAAIRDINGGKVWKKGGLTCGQVINEAVEAWLANGGSASSATGRELLTTMLREARQVANGNVGKYGRSVLTPDDLGYVVSAVLARVGKTHSETLRRYRMALANGYLRREVENIDGARLVEYTIRPEYETLFT